MKVRGILMAFSPPRHTDLQYQFSCFKALRVSKLSQIIIRNNNNNNKHMSQKPGFHCVWSLHPSKLRDSHHYNSASHSRLLGVLHHSMFVCFLIHILCNCLWSLHIVGLKKHMIFQDNSQLPAHCLASSFQRSASSLMGANGSQLDRTARFKTDPDDPTWQIRIKSTFCK